MRDQSTAVSIAAATPRNGVLVLTGYGLRVAVERGHLTVSDGRGRERREGRFPRAGRQLRRLVVLGHTGTVSFDALRWLRDVGCPFVQIDADGAVVVASGPAGLDDPRLRRAQAMATANEAGVGIARDLLGRKLDGQAALLDRFGTPPAGDAAAHVRRVRDALPEAETADRLRWLEADAAARYWGAWSGVPVRWTRRDVGQVPDHWRAFGARSSPLTGSPRLAADPPNALLNYAYAILEAEARIALLAVGLDPGIGVLHADLRARDSLALDLMEAVRPDVDGWVLDALAGRAFARADFHETREGACRLMPPLARLVAEAAPRWAAAVAPVAEGIARTLAEGLPGRTAPGRLPTPLTGDNRSAGRNRSGSGEAKAKRTAPPLAAGCLACGGRLGRRDRGYCAGCLPERRVKQAAAFAGAGPAALAALRANGRDPSHGGEAGRSRGRRNAKHAAAGAAWERSRGDDGSDTDAFARDVLPRLQGVPLRLMAEATGLSAGYCSFVRRGLKVPHRRHWVALRALAEQGGGAVS